MLALAVHPRVGLDELRRLIYAYPTFYGGVGETIGAYGRGVGTVIDPEFAGPALLDEILAEAKGGRVGG